MTKMTDVMKDKQLNEILNIKYPLIQGGMAHIATAEFAAAVSNAGALGLIGSGSMNAEKLREEIHKCKHLTDKPFGVNVMMMNRDVEAIAKMLAEEKVALITTGAGNPGVYVPMWKEAGSLVFPIAPTVALARRLERSGADAIIAEGTEAGGHVGELATMALTPSINRAIDIPVVAAGGIAVREQIDAAFALGAIGVQVGTALLVSEECPISKEYKEAVIKAKDTDAIVIGRNTGAPIRLLKNRMAKAYIEQEKQGATLEELEHYTLGALRRAVVEGDDKEGSLMAGQVAGLLNEIRPLKDIFAEMFE